jgi:hypothetical protein
MCEVRYLIPVFRAVVSGCTPIGVQQTGKPTHNAGFFGYIAAHRETDKPKDLNCLRGVRIARFSRLFRFSDLVGNRTEKTIHD